MPDIELFPDQIDEAGLRRLVAPRAAELGLDPDLLVRIIQTESSGNTRAVSGKGAQGLMQLMPENQKKFGVTDPFDPHQSVMGGTALLKELHDKYGGDQRRMLVDYNGGPRAVAAYNAGAPWKESAGYLEKLMPEPSVDEIKALLAARKPPTEEPSVDEIKKLLAERNKPAEEPGLLTKAARFLGDIPTGIAQGLVGTGADALKLAQQAGPSVDAMGIGAPILKLMQQVSPDTVASLEEQATPKTAGQKTGKVVERIGEFAIPSVGVDTAVERLAARALPSVINNAAGRVAVNAGELGARMAAQAPLGAGEAALRGENPKVGAAIAATGPVLGAMGEGAAPVAKEAARAALRSALKVPMTVLRNSAKSMGTTLPEKLESVIDTVLGSETGGKYVTNPASAESHIGAKEDLLDIPVDAATAAGVPVDAPRMAQDVLDKELARVGGASDPVARRAALEAKKQVLAESGGSHSMPGPPVVTMQPGPVLGPNGQPIMTAVSTPGPNVLRPSMTPRATLDSSRLAQSKQWGLGTDPNIIDAEKLVEIAERDALKKAVPATAPILESQGKLIVTKKALDRAALREANRDPLTLTTAAALHGNPVIALGHQALKMSGVNGGVMLDMLGKALERNDVRAVATILRTMGYGELLNSLPQEKP